MDAAALRSDLRGFLAHPGIHPFRAGGRGLAVARVGRAWSRSRRALAESKMSQTKSVGSALAAWVFALSAAEAAPQSGERAPRIATRLELSIGSAPIGMAVAELDGSPGAELVTLTREPGELHVFSGLSPELGGRAESSMREVPAFGVGPVVLEGPTPRVLIGRAEPPALVAFDVRAGDSGLELEPGVERELSGQVRALVAGAFELEGPREVAVALHDHERGVASLRLFSWPESGDEVVLGDELPTCLAFAPRGEGLLVGCQRGPSLRLIARGPEGARELAAAGLPGIPRAVAEVELDGDAAPELLIVGGSGSAWVAGFEDPRSYVEDLADGSFDDLLTWGAGGIPVDLMHDADGAGGVSTITALSWADMVAVTAERFSRGGPVDPTVRYAGLSPRTLGSGDLDGDGWTDLLAASPDSGSISIWFGSASGVFMPETRPAAPAPFSVTSGDLDGDGATDLAMLSAVEEVVLLQLSGRTEPVRLPCPPGAVRCRLADLDGDGALDLALLRESAGAAYLDVLLGDGRGGLAPAPGRSSLKVGRDASALDSGQLDGAPGEELFVALGADARLAVVGLRGDGVALLGALPLQGKGTAIALERGTDGRVRSVAVAEADPTNARLRLFAAGQDGALSERNALPIDRPVDGLGVGDVDGDGVTDLVAVMSGLSGTHTGSLRVLTRAFSPDRMARREILVETGPDPRTVIVTDLDGDGSNEVVATSLGWNHLRVWSWDADAQALDRSWDLGAHRACLEVLYVDIDPPTADGAPELVVCNNFSSDLSIIRFVR
jgi:hypothetical protein